MVLGADVSEIWKAGIGQTSVIRAAVNLACIQIRERRINRACISTAVAQNDDRACKSCSPRRQKEELNNQQPLYPGEASEGLPLQPLSALIRMRPMLPPPPPPPSPVD